jgi:undecaprenyl-diphosphatase
MLGMSQVRFSVFNATSAVIWAPFYILPGYLAGSAINLALPSNFYPALFSLTAALLVMALSFRYANLNLQYGSRTYDSLISSRGIRHSESEYPLASLALFAGAGLFFTIWSYLVLKTGLLSNIDESMSQLSASLRGMSPFINEMVTRIFVHLTLIGDEKFLYVSFIILIGLMLHLRQYRASILLVVSGLSTAAITHTLKAVFSVARPELVQIPPSSYAYPSGHSSGAVVFYGLIAAFVAQNLVHSQRWKCYLLFFIPMFLIAFSRVMLSVHWLTDVVGGITLGLAICGISRVVYSSHLALDNQKRREKSEERRAIAVTLGVWVSAIVVYQFTFFAEAMQKYQLQP